MLKQNTKNETGTRRKKLSHRITACGISAVMAISFTFSSGNSLQLQAATTEQYNVTENGDMTYIAVMKNESSYDKVTARAESMDALSEEQPAQLEQNNIAVLELDEADADRIEQMNGVVALEEDIILTANEEVPIDEEAVDELVESGEEIPFSQWNMDAVNLADASGLSGSGVKVAVLDSGIASSEDLLVDGYKDLTDSGNENPLFNHDKRMNVFPN